MKLAISNIAWDKNQDEQISKLLQKYNIQGLEVALTKIWQDPANVSEDEILEYKNYWGEKGISIVAAQSLLFGHPELNIFKNSEETMGHISFVLKTLSLLGVRIVVFGSPKNRSFEGISKGQAFEQASVFFGKIAEISKSFGITFCIEPNPQDYGTNFVNNTDEAIELVKVVNHPNFKLHLDLSTMVINKEDYKKSIEKGFPYLSHFHISEPSLRTINNSTDVDHGLVADTLRNLSYNGWVSIEMLTKKEREVEMIDSAFSYVSKIYA